ncbi:hypothetical protein AsAng_0028860 [Aureispira anguillae]|uniref:Uncharacterized protein n=1 Tax=Aureispira anguillae TaxID=2864201 RepID=A0A916DSW9_9BACT|nr:hypothetical protein AsAng_0028860 [Aureispira anguillae]
MNKVKNFSFIQQDIQLNIALFLKKKRNTTVKRENTSKVNSNFVFYNLFVSSVSLSPKY